MVAIASAMEHLHQARRREASAPTLAGRRRDQLDHLTVLSLGASETLGERTAIARGWLGNLVKACREGFDSAASMFPGTQGLKDLSWGWIQWVLLRPFFLADLVLQGSIEEVDHQSRELLEGQYHRIKPAMSEIGDMSEMIFFPTEHLIKEVEAQAEALRGGPLMREAITWIDERWMGTEAVNEVAPGATVTATGV
jgi:hypothetical protein